MRATRYRTRLPSRFCSTIDMSSALVMRISLLGSSPAHAARRVNSSGIKFIHSVEGRDQAVQLARIEDPLGRVPICLLAKDVVSADLDCACLFAIANGSAKPRRVKRGYP